MKNWVERMVKDMAKVLDNCLKKTEFLKKDLIKIKKSLEGDKNENLRGGKESG